MSYSVSFDPQSRIASYPYPTLLSYSPPNAYPDELIAWMHPDSLSEFIPKAWASTDLTLVPALVPPPPLFADAELADLFALKELRERYKARILDEDEKQFDDPILRLLESHGVDLDQVLPAPSGKSARQHIRDLWDLVKGDSGCLVLSQKALFNRPRPWQMAPGLHPMLQPPHAAYPSGHSTQITTFAWVIEEALQKTPHEAVSHLFTDYAGSAARRREIAGLHYRSDTVAGLTLARRIVEKYLESEDFKRLWLAPLSALR